MFRGRTYCVIAAARSLGRRCNCNLAALDNSSLEYAFLRATCQGSYLFCYRLRNRLGLLRHSHCWHRSRSRHRNGDKGQAKAAIKLAKMSSMRPPSSLTTYPSNLLPAIPPLGGGGTPGTPGTGVFGAVPFPPAPAPFSAATVRYSRTVTVSAPAPSPCLSSSRPSWSRSPSRLASLSSERTGPAMTIYIY